MSKSDQQIALERIVFFSDAVMAIAITLLALDLKISDIDAVGADRLSARLLQLTPQLLIFLLSFALIGFYWSAHHRYFRFIQRYDTPLIALNFVFLFFVVCIPFVASVIGRYASVPLAVFVYSATIAALGLSLAAIWWHATRRHRLVAPDLDAATIRSAKIRLLGGPIVIFVAAPFVYFGREFAIVTWALAVVGVLAITRWSRASRSGQPRRHRRRA